MISRRVLLFALVPAALSLATGCGSKSSPSKRAATPAQSAQKAPVPNIDMGTLKKGTTFVFAKGFSVAPDEIDSSIDSARILGDATFTNAAPASKSELPENTPILTPTGNWECDIQFQHDVADSIAKSDSPVNFSFNTTLVMSKDSEVNSKDGSILLTFEDNTSGIVSFHLTANTTENQFVNGIFKDYDVQIVQPAATQTATQAAQSQCAHGTVFNGSECVAQAAPTKSDVQKASGAAQQAVNQAKSNVDPEVQALGDATDSASDNANN